MSDEVLIYLLGDSQGRKRDMIAQCYYAAAQGDPKSGPVVFAVLLNSCAEQFAKTPQELLKVVAEFGRMLAEGREMEARIRERVELSNYGVVAEFKDETRRASNALRETVDQTLRMGEKASRVAREMEPVIATVKQITQDLPSLADDLKQHRESAKEIAVEMGMVKTIHQENQALIKRLGNEARANWFTLGLGFGMVLTYALDQSQAPPWTQFIFFIFIAGFAQWFSRLQWDFLEGWIKKEKTSFTNLSDKKQSELPPAG